MDVRHGTTSTRGRWLTFARGLVALFLGAALLVAGQGQSRLATFIALYWLLGAVLTLRWALSSRQNAGRRLGVLAAGIGAVTAVALLARSPLNDAVGTGVLLDIVGTGAVVTGVLRMLGVFREDQLATGRPLRRNGLVVGVLDVGLGAALILTSDATSTWIRFIAAAWGLVAGTFLVLDATRTRALAREAPR